MKHTSKIGEKNEYFEVTISESKRLFLIYLKNPINQEKRAHVERVNERSPWWLTWDRVLWLKQQSCHNQLWSSHTLFWMNSNAKLQNLPLEQEVRAQSNSSMSGHWIYKYCSIFFKSHYILVNFLLSCCLSFFSLQRIANLLPAWYYNFRVTMVTWGDPELSCCDSSTISFITGKQHSHGNDARSRRMGKNAVFHLRILKIRVFNS